MIDSNLIATALQIPCIVSATMQQAMEQWEDLYVNQGEWQKNRVRPLRIPSILTKELKRLILTEFTASVNNIQTDIDFQAMIPLLRRKLDFGLAVGGLLFKPYWSASGVHVDIVTQNQYLPVNFTNDTCDAIACPQSLTIGKYFYTRIELHKYNPQAMTHMITNRCFRSRNSTDLGTECSLAEVGAWADILPEKTFERVQKPLFAVFQMPDANNIDITSPLGISAYADAIDFIRDADIHWERILWELESSERAIDASEDLFRYRDGKPVLPKGRERMFRSYEKTPDGGSIFNTFSPEIRDVSYFNAFNQILRRIENAVGFSYGTLSEVSDVEKTAEEIKSSKQRSFARIQDIQANLQTALEQLVYGMQYYHNYYENSNQQAKLTCTFGDGVLEDTDKEFNRRLQLVTSGNLKPEKLLAWYFGCSEEEALKYMPAMSNDGGLFDGDD